MKFLLIYVPNLRFTNLNKLVKVRLGDICTITGGYAFDSLKMTQKGEYQIIKMGNLYNGIFDLSRNSSFINAPTKKELDYLIQENDILITLTGTTNKKDYGYTVQMEQPKNLLLNQRCALIRASKVNEKYLFYLLNSNDFLKQFYASSTGGTGNQTNVSINDMLDFKVCISNENDQLKISNILSALDKKILTQIKIINDYKILKNHIIKSFIKQNGTSYLLSEIAELGRGRVINSAEISKQKNPIYPVYSSQTSNNGIMGYLDNYDYEGEYITWTTDGANAGTVYYRNGKFNCTNVCGILKIKNGYDAYYISNILNCYTKKYVSTNLANPKLMNNVMANIKINLPSIEQQKHSSKILQSIEYRVEIEEDIKLNLVKQKAFLLKNMFI